MALTHDYDKESNRTNVYDVRIRAQQGLSYEYAYDGLDRLTEAVKGQNGGGSFAAVAGGEQWDLDMLGNWSEKITDTASSYGTFDGGDDDEDRLHNGVNELEVI